MMMLPEELIMLVQKKVNDHATLLNLKMSCTYFNKVITRAKLNISLTKEIIDDKFSNYNDLRICANANCYDDTEFIYINQYYRNNLYVHYHQPALNNTKIRINKKDYNVRSPYCCECFVKHVLIGSKTNVRRDLSDEFKVNIDY